MNEWKIKKIKIWNKLNLKKKIYILIYRIKRREYLKTQINTLNIWNQWNEKGKFFWIENREKRLKKWKLNL